jgi:hypothetical protein
MRQIFNDVLVLGSMGIWIKCFLSNHALGQAQHCVRGWLLNLKRIGRWRRSGSGWLIDSLSLSLITWKSFISVFSIFHINRLKHVYLRSTRGSIPMVEMTCVSPLRRDRILCNHILLLNRLGGTLHKFSDSLTMRELFCIVVFLTNHTRKFRFPSQLSINKLRIILLVRRFLGFTLVFLLISWLLR